MIFPFLRRIDKFDLRIWASAGVSLSLDKNRFSGSTGNICKFDYFLAYFMGFLFCSLKRYVQSIRAFFFMSSFLLHLFMTNFLHLIKVLWCFSFFNVCLFKVCFDHLLVFINSMSFFLILSSLSINNSTPTLRLGCLWRWKLKPLLSTFLYVFVCSFFK